MSVVCAVRLSACAGVRACVCARVRTPIMWSCARVCVRGCVCVRVCVRGEFDHEEWMKSFLYIAWISGPETATSSLEAENSGVAGTYCRSEKILHAFELHVIR